MRIFCLSILAVILSACSAFYVVPGYNPYVSLDPPTIQHWQKPNTIGHTNVDKRWQDAQECGVKNYVNGTLDLSVSYPGMTTEQVKQRSKSISTCMENKGYIYLKNTECVDGKNNKLTGLCN
ncbi:hypothetical protein RCH20_002507 [Psychrobacter sp. PL15]|uniref:hypothetical protein n=1 Tax=Psychrobacter sp. PL15 TaxID=3071719 RepID=UPI002DFCEFB7|nr:hypothetical protein [Psychrobacter sp. PL15]